MINLFYDNDINKWEIASKTTVGCNITFFTDQPTFSELFYDICKELNIEPSKCAIFGLADQTHTEFGEFDRGTEWRRVCVSSLLGDMKDIHSKQ